jgi:hypothetical protein
MDESFYKIIDKLIDDLPDEYKNTENPLVFDLVLDSGVFNGSYIIGALYFLKEMEKRNYIKIDRISGSSIGSLSGFLYLTDNLDLFYILYNKIYKYLKKKYNLKILKKIKKLLSGHIPKKIYNKLNNKLFIKYNNIELNNNNAIIKSSYKNTDEIYETIIRSCFFPLLIDGNMSIDNKYIDGINPYIFEKCPNKKIIFLDLIGIDKFNNILNVKNEKSNFNRILYGLVDIHKFLTKNESTFMCSYVNDWKYINNIYFNIRLIFEKLICYIFHCIIFIKKKIFYFFPNISYEFITKITNNILKELLDKCIF